MFQKLFTASQIKEIDLQSIKKQKIKSEDLMERAATRLYNQAKQEIRKHQQIFLFCGTGNNGGDALVLARLFAQNAYDVTCIIVPFSKNTSHDFDVNLHRLMKTNVEIEIFELNKMGKLPKSAVVIDGIFGTGLSRPATGIAAQAIDYINKSTSLVISVDVPSGLYADRSNNTSDMIVASDIVYSFEFPKLSFLFPENHRFVKKNRIVKIGLSPSVIRKMPTPYFLLTDKVRSIIKKRDAFAYKNTFGHALLIGGSYGMIGAMILSTRAAMKIGAGLVTAYVPKKGCNILQIANPEVMVLTDRHNKHLTHIETKKVFDAIGIGTGMGMHVDTTRAFLFFLKKQNKPMLIDADALNILAMHKKYLKQIPKQSILTPHIGEFKRLVGTWQNDTEKLEKLQTFAKEYQVIIVLKGAYTTICDGDFLYINPIANAALATAGSGDVLSGMITGLLAQSYQALEAALLGVYLHAKTADKFVIKQHDFAMIASDIIQGLTKV